MYRHLTGIRLCRMLIILIGSSPCFSSYVAATDARDKDVITYEKLRYYKELYSEEIYYYCTERHSSILSKLAKCLRLQASLKRSSIGAARTQFGSQELAQSVYDDCRGRYPENGVRLIAVCVDSRIMLNAKLGDIPIEQAIYQACEAKWRKHGIKIVHNCCIHSGNYYLRFGELQEQ